MKNMLVTLLIVASTSATSAVCEFSRPNLPKVEMNCQQFIPGPRNCSAFEFQEVSSLTKSSKTLTLESVNTFSSTGDEIASTKIGGWRPISAQLAEDVISGKTTQRLIIRITTDERPGIEKYVVIDAVSAKPISRLLDDSGLLRWRGHRNVGDWSFRIIEDLTLHCRG
jgi:hypothetical protein